MSTVKANDVTATTTNSNVKIKGNGTGVVSLGDGNLLFPDADGSSGQAITTNASGQLAFSTISSAHTEETPLATTSGTQITFGSLPSGITEIIIACEGVSNTTTVDWFLELGDAGGLETSGYLSSTMAIENSAQVGIKGASNFVLKNVNAAAATSNILIRLNLVDASAFLWSFESTCINATGTVAEEITIGGGFKALTAELTQVSVNVVSGAFDLGTVHCLHR